MNSNNELIKRAKEAINNLKSEYELEKTLLKKVIVKVKNGDVSAVETLKYLLHDMNDILDDSLNEKINEIIENY